MSQAQIGNLQVALGINTAQFSAGLSQAQGSLANFGKGLKSFAAAAAATLSLGAIGMAIKANIDNMDNLGKAAQKIGIPVEELSKLEYAARLADVSLDDLSSTLSKFSKNIAEIGGGGENDAGRALAAIGISATDAQGKLVPTVSLLEQIADEFSVMKDSAAKTALAIALFGKSGAQMIPLLNGGREAIRAAGVELQQFGGVVTAEAAAAAETFNDNVTRMQAALQGLTQQAVIPLLKPLIEVTEAILDFANTGPQVASGLGTIGDALKWLTEMALNAYSAIWSIGELASTALTDPLNTDAWDTSLERIRMQAEATQEAIENIRNPGIKASASDIQSMLDSIGGGEEKKDAPILPDLKAAKKATDEAAKALENLKAQGQAVWESTRTPLENYQLGLRNLNDLLQQGVIDHDTYNRAVTQLQDEFAQAIPAANEFGETLQGIGETISDSLGTALQGLISGTMSVKDAFQSMVASISQQLAQLATQLIQSAIFKLLGSLLGGGFLGAGGMSFGGFYAEGGHLGSGQWGIAGENGPEIIHGPANITPMDKASGGGAELNVTVINNSAASVNTRKNSKGELEVLIEDMMAEKLIRGGNKIDAALARGYGLRRAGRS